MTAVACIPFASRFLPFTLGPLFLLLHSEVTIDFLIVNITASSQSSSPCLSFPLTSLKIPLFYDFPCLQGRLCYPAVPFGLLPSSTVSCSEISSIPISLSATCSDDDSLISLQHQGPGPPLLSLTSNFPSSLHSPPSINGSPGL